MSEQGSVQAVVDTLRGAQRITSICHQDPDADTLGAALAMLMIGERLGKQVEAVSADPPAPGFAFLPRFTDLRRAPSLEPDIAVVCDSAALYRIGAVATEHREWLDASRIVNVDHHVSNPRYGAINHVDPASAATCEVVTLLLPELGVELDRDLATVLLAGIVQDTHCLTHPATTPRTLRVVAELVEAGAPLAAINRAIYADRSFSTLALWGLMLAEVGQRLDGRIVHASLTQEMLSRTGSEQWAADDFVDLLGSTKAADVTVLFRELDPTSTRASVRTTERADAAAIVRPLGGGGHARAAGCVLPEPLDSAREVLLRACAEALDGAADAGSDRNLVSAGTVQTLNRP